MEKVKKMSDEKEKSLKDKRKKIRPKLFKIGVYVMVFLAIISIKWASDGNVVLGGSVFAVACAYCLSYFFYVVRKNSFSEQN